MIDGVLVVPLRQICDERGKIMHMLRADAPHFAGFGEVYFSVTYPGVVKAWHQHTRQTQNYAVPVGMIKLVLCDRREGSPTRGQVQKLVIGEWNYVLVRIPVGVAYGFQCVGEHAAVICNCPDIPHEDGEGVSIDRFSSEIPYDWAQQV
jgi:dTDP-4-dehydrorhamnose 3,5-epimerase